MKAGELIVSLAKSAGFDTSDKAMIDVLSRAEFANTEIPESVVNALTNNLLTVESAKNNPALKSHYYGHALDSINKGVEDMLNEYGIDDATKAEIVADKNTYNKYKIAVKKIAELKEKSANTGSKTDKAEYEKQIIELNQKILQSTTEAQSKIDALRSEYEGKILNREIDYTLSGKQLPGQFDRDVEINIARQFVDKKLEVLGAITTTENGKIVLRQKANPEMALFVDNKPLTFDALTDMALAENKFIKVSQPANGSGANGFNPITNGGPTPQQNPTRNAALAEIDAVLDGFK